MLASQYSVKRRNNRFNIFSIFLLCLNFILIITFLTSRRLIFYFLFEASLIPTLLLILGWGYQPERLQAGIYIMIYTVAASLPLLFVILWASQEFSSSEILIIRTLRSHIFDLNIN